MVNDKRVGGDRDGDIDAYNTGRRCPRELQCKHSFCERCLIAISRPSVTEGESTQEYSRQDRTIVCPLCRCPTSVSGTLRIALRADERVLEQLADSGVPEESSTDDEEEVDECEEETAPENSAEDGDSPSGSRGGRFRCSLKRFWGKLTGNRHQRRTNCLSDEEVRDLAMMSCYII
ncbi:hypothetical protein DPEC_G00103520 [Dallia pectoralis]|uniref:Uncharacterized protein n=1 Tax=Dallia pectoralis TaxID=75939 RepID=A0ACC2GXC5_DALPE|nr:hypothetical protein DPEC_G00103520 [Dallia pectoralis]